MAHCVFAPHHGRGTRRRSTLSSGFDVGHACGRLATCERTCAQPVPEASVGRGPRCGSSERAHTVDRWICVSEKIREPHHTATGTSAAASLVQQGKVPPELLEHRRLRHLLGDGAVAHLGAPHPHTGAGRRRFGHEQQRTVALGRAGGPAAARCPLVVLCLGLVEVGIASTLLEEAQEDAAAHLDDADRRRQPRAGLKQVACPLGEPFQHAVNRHSARKVATEDLGPDKLRHLVVPLAAALGRRPRREGRVYDLCTRERLLQQRASRER
mmetsp:Transcript_57563/g.151139  ORF Transcript_57563/g.151139 Transcript_57563/m.151139 type:complete len:269 (-) Transcript_57563:293-1099(-)